jgi:hypothetical protein
MEKQGFINLFIYNLIMVAGINYRKEIVGTIGGINRKLEIHKEAILGEKDRHGRHTAMLEEIMRPGGASVAGFLGPKQSLIDVIESDSRKLERLGITHKQVSDRMVQIIAQLAAPHGDIDLPFELSRTEPFQLGGQICPFSSLFADGCGGSGSANWIITNTQLKASFRVSELLFHLIRDHHFFEGIAPYRVDPEKAVRILEIKPGVDYTLRTEVRTQWSGFGSSTTDIECDWLGSQDIIKNAERILVLGENITAYITENKVVIVTTEAKDNIVEEPLIIEGELLMEKGRKLWKGQITLSNDEREFIVGSWVGLWPNPEVIVKNWMRKTSWY